jgi:hypothetical protein
VKLLSLLITKLLLSLASHEFTELFLSGIINSTQPLVKSVKLAHVKLEVARLRATVPVTRSGFRAKALTSS